VTGHQVGVFAVLAGLAVASAALWSAFGAVGGAVAALLWLGLGVLLVDVEALQR
jgi:hypothetical protein